MSTEFTFLDRFEILQKSIEESENYLIEYNKHILNRRSNIFQYSNKNKSSEDLY